LIKANFPARIAFAVAGSVDSRVILDQPGAERLLGRGDMLYMSGDSPSPQRLQGVFLSDAEIGNITRYWRSQITEAELAAMFKPLGATLTSSDDESSSRSGSGAAIFSRGASGSSSSTSMPWERENATRRARDRNNNDEDMDDDVDMDDDSDDVGDEMYEQAVEMVRRLNRASVSLLQRRLRIGYTRAARLIDMMEERGIVGPATEGSKPREVLPER
jgi:S-DNA-T family DNA segregation ATPase FtsK/SpoIIIE